MSLLYKEVIGAVFKAAATRPYGSPLNQTAQPLRKRHKSAAARSLLDRDRK